MTFLWVGKAIILGRVDGELLISCTLRGCLVREKSLGLGIVAYFIII